MESPSEKTFYQFLKVDPTANLVLIRYASKLLLGEYELDKNSWRFFVVRTSGKDLGHTFGSRIESTIRSELQMRGCGCNPIRRKWRRNVRK